MWRSKRGGISRIDTVRSSGAGGTAYQPPQTSSAGHLLAFSIVDFRCQNRRSPSIWCREIKSLIPRMLKAETVSSLGKKMQPKAAEYMGGNWPDLVAEVRSRSAYAAVPSS